MEKLYMEYLNQKGNASQGVIKARGAYEEALENYVEAVQEWEFHETVDFMQMHCNLSPHSGESVKDDRHSLDRELEEIHFKYERLTSLIGILQMFVAEVVDVAGAPEDSLNNALYEIEGEMEKTNNRLRCLFTGKGGATV